MVRLDEYQRILHALIVVKVSFQCRDGEAIFNIAEKDRSG